MAGYVGTKAVLLSTTAANVGGDADIGGDLTVDTSTLHVDSTNNRVGVGTSSPSDVLHVVTPTFGGLTLECTGATADPTFKFLGDSGNYWSIQQDASQGDSFQFRYNNSEKVRIDSAGRVTTPSQPAFTAQPTTFTGSGGIAGAPTFIFATALLNIGGHFNTSNGRFTAPVAGNYFFTFSITASSSSKSARYFRVRLAKNGTRVLNPHNTISDEAGNADYNCISASGLVAMNANDYVELNYGSSIDASGFVFYDDMNTFSGFLMS